MEEMHDVIIGMDAINAIRTQITLRQSKRKELWEQMVDLDGQIAGLREAEYQIQKQTGYNVALTK